MSESVFRTLSVGELALWAGRSGDLGRRSLSVLRGVEGSRAHRLWQRAQEESYRAEVSLKLDVELEGLSLRLQGRVDGLRSDGVMEELKTTREEGEQLPLDFGIHRMQLQIYLWMWQQLHGDTLGGELIYLRPDGEQVWKRIPMQAELEEVDAALKAWAETWREGERAKARSRDSIAALSWPFPEWRPGQPELAEAAEAVIQRGVRLYAQAPTGSGKSMGLLWPLLQAFSRGEISRVFIATCRNAVKEVHEEALERLQEDGLQMRALTLQARDRLCQQEGGACDMESCPLAKGFYDRLPAGVKALRKQPLWTLSRWRALSAEHQLCPYAFQLWAAQEADLLIGDINLLLHPTAKLKSWLEQDPENTVLWIDEAHQVLERGRGMRSASLPRIPGAKELNREWNRARNDLLGEKGEPVPDAEPPFRLAQACGRRVEELELLEPNAERLEELRRLLDFQRCVEDRDASHVLYQEGRLLHWLCRDVRDWLATELDIYRAVVFCSATLEPLEHFKRWTGGSRMDEELLLPAVFSAEALQEEVERGISLRYADRRKDLPDKLAQRILRFLQEKPGKSLLFFSSYQLMEDVKARLPTDDLWIGPVQAQPRGLQEEETELFLRPFREEAGPRCALAVLGGALNEGIDLPGEALEQVVIVGMGYPAFSPEQELLRTWAEAQGEPGFEYAYERIARTRREQAKGRVLRSMEDRGRLLWIDSRYEEKST